MPADRHICGDNCDHTQADDRTVSFTPAQPDGWAALKECPFCGGAPFVAWDDEQYAVMCSTTNCRANWQWLAERDDAIDTWNARPPIPPASPEREAVYRALDEWLDAMDVTAKAAQLSGPSTDPYTSAIFTDKLAHQRFAEAASRYRLALNAAAHREPSNA